MCDDVMCVDKTPEEIQELFGMEESFSREEYERLLTENKVRRGFVCVY